ncbi:hypothetical protein ACJD0Z_02495 [Flavobacteriaceae bacterium M23B6Z8]
MKTTQVSLKFPVQFARYINHIESLEFEGESVQSFIEELENTYGNIRERLFEEDGSVKPYINLFVGKKNIQSMGGLECKVNDGDQISLLLSRAGG